METEKITPVKTSSLDSQPTEDKNVELSLALSNLAVKLQEWDATDIEFISPALKKALDTCREAYEQKNNPDLLLCALLIQLGVSNAITKAIMGNVFKMKAIDPKENLDSMKKLSTELIGLSAVIKDNDALASKIRALLVFAYSNNLIPGFSKSGENKPQA